MDYIVPFYGSLTLYSPSTLRWALTSINFYSDKPMFHRILNYCKEKSLSSLSSLIVPNFNLLPVSSKLYMWLIATTLMRSRSHLSVIFDTFY